MRARARMDIIVTTFSDFDLHANVLKAVVAEGYETPTPIQAQAIPALLKGRDLLGIAQTGTGKTAAFTLPTLTKLMAEPRKPQPKEPRVLVLAPTRELALQIAESFKTYARFMPLSVETVFGGVKILGQIRALKKGPDVVVATPGRLCDLIRQKAVSLKGLKVLILDEADQMLDFGFVRDLRAIMAEVPNSRQTLLFSATMPKSIGDLAQNYLSDPVRVSVTPQSSTAERVAQGVLHVDASNKPEVLRSILSDESIDRVLVFTRTKHGADKVVRKLEGARIEAKAIHGNKSQSQRVRALDAFRAGPCKVLVATDIAARGIDVEGVSHVVNYDLPNVAEQYVHRIGRTARAGRTGFALSLVSPEDLYFLREVEKVSKQTIPALEAPEGCADLILPEPDRSLRVAKPKGPSGHGQPRRPQASKALKRPQSETAAAKKTGEKLASTRKRRSRRAKDSLLRLVNAKQKAS